MTKDSKQTTEQAPSQAPGRSQAATLLFIACLTLLLGCGPGVVGTGTGASALADACSSHVAAWLASCTAQTGSSGAPASASSAIVLIDAGDGNPAQAVVTVAAERASLRVACLGLEFSGAWSRFEDGSLGYDGSVRSARQPAPTRAILRVEPAPSGSGRDLRLLIEDELGVTLAGPWLVRRTSLPVIDAPCLP